MSKTWGEDGQQGTCCSRKRMTNPFSIYNPARQHNPPKHITQPADMVVKPQCKHVEEKIGHHYRLLARTVYTADTQSAGASTSTKQYGSIIRGVAWTRHTHKHTINTHSPHRQVSHKHTYIYVCPIILSNNIHIHKQHTHRQLLYTQTGIIRTEKHVLYTQTCIIHRHAGIIQIDKHVL